MPTPRACPAAVRSGTHSSVTSPKQRSSSCQRGLPIISVDTKKKELVGNFKNAGRVWSQEATPVNDHDFRSQGQGMAIPFGVYDPVRNRGSVFVGTSHDTPQFAAENIARWWRQSGRRHYPEADHLLILADSGGSNGARVRPWKWALQKQLADPFGLTVTVCHLSHRRLQVESDRAPALQRDQQTLGRSTAGQLRDHRRSLIGSTTTQTGLQVRSQLVRRHYPTQCKVSDAQFKTIHLDPHPVLPGWNYTIFPTENRN